LGAASYLLKNCRVSSLSNVHGYCRRMVQSLQGYLHSYTATCPSKQGSESFYLLTRGQVCVTAKAALRPLSILLTAPLNFITFLALVFQLKSCFLPEKQSHLRFIFRSLTCRHYSFLRKPSWCTLFEVLVLRRWGPPKQVV
jgi:hypothetical protein